MPRLHASLLFAVLLLAGCGSDRPDAPTPDSALPEPEFTDSAAAPGSDLATASATTRTPDDSTTYVLVLGNSLTAGFGLADPTTQAYPALLQARADDAGLDAQIVNAGVSGDTSAGGARRIDWVLRRQPVDVLVLALGGNDGLRGLDPGAMEANLVAVIGAVRDQNPEADVVIAGMEAPPNMGDDYTAAFRQVFRDVAAEHDAALIPFLLDGVGGVPAMNLPDGIHPTSEGQQRLAANVWPVLREVLQ